MTIGSTNHISLDQARKRAQQILAAVASGEDPQNVRFNLRQAPKILDLWKRFDGGELHQKKPATQRDYRSNWNGLLEPKFGNVLVRELIHLSIDRIHQSLSNTPSRANRTLALLSKLMTLAEIWEWRDQGTNPCRYIKKYKEQSRERYLSQEEIGRMGGAMSELVEEGAIWPDMARAISLRLLTGARKSEVLNLELAWVSLEHSVIQFPDSKTGKKSLFLSNVAVSLLKIQREESRYQDS